MDFVTYLEALPPISISKLYSSEWTCQAVLRGLPPLAKQYVVRMLWADGPIPQRVVEAWPTKEGLPKHRSAMDKLERLQIVKGDARGGERQVLMHPTFRERLRWSLTTAGLNIKRDVPPSVAAVAPTLDVLHKHARQQWEKLLLYVAGSEEKPPPPSKLLDAPKLAIDRLMQGAGLTSLEDGQSALTEAGFHFLLLDTYNQLWTLLRGYIANAEQRSGAELASVVSFLLQLGFREVGVPAPLSELKPLERTIASDMAQLGLIYPFRADGEVWISPTQLAAAVGGSGSAENQEVTEGFVVVETNYRVYAYTSSPLQYAILRLFIRCECILPNLFVGTLTRESVTSALSCGLTADQIINFLRQHASPHVANRVPVVPEVVADQIRLWQADSRRVRQTRAVLYDDFASPVLFQKTAAYARQIGVWLWEDGKGSGRLAARADGHEKMREFIRANK